MVMGGSSRATLHWLGSPPKSGEEGKGQIPGPLPSAGRGRMGPADRWAGDGAGTGAPAWQPCPAWGKASCLLSSPQTRSPGTRVGQRAGQKGGPVVSSFQMEKNPTFSLRKSFARSVSAGVPSVHPSLLEPPRVARGGGRRRSRAPLRAEGMS